MLSDGLLDPSNLSTSEVAALSQPRWIQPEL